MNQLAYRLNIILFVDWVSNLCGWDKLLFVNMFTTIGVHLFTLVSPQNVLMFYVGKKCMKVGGILQESLSLGVEQC